jgi:hypothetical protein
MNRIEESLFGNVNKISSNTVPVPAISKEPPNASIFSSESPVRPEETSSIGNFFDFRNIIIFVLLFVFLLAFIGINLFNLLGGSIQDLIDLGGPVLKDFLKALGYSTGTAINKTADVAADIAKQGVDIAEGAVQDVGNLLIDHSSDLDNDMHENNNNRPMPIEPPQPSNRNRHKSDSLEDSIEKKHNNEKGEPSSDSSENPIQKPITSDKTSWCLIGEYNNKRGCVSVTDSTSCLSGQIFPSQQMCLNPTFTQNAN